MKDLLSEIYEKVVYASDMYNELNQTFDSEVEKLLQPLKENLSPDELDELRGLIYTASFVAEKNGFYMGIHTAMKFVTESLSISDETK